MQPHKALYSRRYAPIYERGYLACLGNTYFGVSKGWTVHYPNHPPTDLIDNLQIYGRSNPTRLSVDDFTKGMGPKAAAAFEDGWFDALEDGLTMHEYSLSKEDADA